MNHDNLQDCGDLQEARAAASALCTAVELYLRQECLRSELVNACKTMRKVLEKQPQPRGEIHTASIPHRRIPGFVSPPDIK